MINHIIFDWQGVIQQTDGINNELLDWIKNNKSKYSFSILTNCPGNFNKKLSKLKIDHLFEAVVNPSNEFIRKPQPKAYKRILEEVNKKPNECLFIDDSVTNVQVANELEINGIVYTDNLNLFKEFKELNI
ncbi:MAG: HAD-IA family hydrolase [Patescibacteria group bacterium]